MKEKRKVIHFY